jgi:hypothetical protein
VKVVFIYRRRTKGTYSIEELFRTIAGELCKHIQVVEYETGGRWAIATDVWRLRKKRANIYHLTGDINYLALFLPHKKTVLTMHDIGHYLFGLRGFRRWIYKFLWLVWPIRVARAVTVVSKQTRDNVRKHLKVLGAHIEIIETVTAQSLDRLPGRLILPAR